MPTAIRLAKPKLDLDKIKQTFNYSQELIDFFQSHNESKCQLYPKLPVTIYRKKFDDWVKGTLSLSLPGFGYSLYGKDVGGYNFMKKSKSFFKLFQKDRTFAKLGTHKIQFQTLKDAEMVEEAFNHYVDHFC